MNIIKKALGLVWLLLGPFAAYLLISQAIKAIAKADTVLAAATSDKARVVAEAAKTNTTLQWGIIVLIFVPVAIGLVIFGKYSLQGEYDSE